MVTLPYLRQRNKILEKDTTPQPRWSLGDKTVVFRRLVLGDWKLHPRGLCVLVGRAASGPSSR